MLPNTVFNEMSLFDSTLSQLCAVHSSDPYFSKIRLNTICQSKPVCQKRYLPDILYIAHISHFFHAFYMSLHIILLDLITLTTLGEEHRFWKLNGCRVSLYVDSHSAGQEAP
jgi:hypothetical protein